MKKVVYSILCTVICSVLYNTTFASGDGLSAAEKSFCDGQVKIQIDSVISTLSEQDRFLYIYCLTAQSLGISDIFASEQGLMDYGTNIKDVSGLNLSAAVVKASEYEKTLLTEKKKALEQSSQKIKGSLNYEERKTLRELNAGLNCGGGDTGNVLSCMRDLRKYEDYLQSKYTGLTASISIKMDLFFAQIANNFLSVLSELINFFAFGYNEFDSLPNLPYTQETMFKMDQISGVINSFALAILGFLILFYFLKKGTGRNEDDYKTFFIKLAIIFVCTYGFPTLYSWLQSLLSMFDNGLTQSLAVFLPKDIAESVIKMNVVSESGISSFSFLTIFLFAINIILLALISLCIFVRNLFVIFLGNLFFLTSIGIMLGVVRDENIFESGTRVAKGAKLLVRGMFWSLGVFISIVISIFLFKVITVFVGSTPSIEGPDGVSMIKNVSKFSIDALVYFLLLGGTLYVWFKYILAFTFEFVSNFIMSFLFPNSGSFGGLQNFTDDLAKNYTDIINKKEGFLKENKDIVEKVDFGKQFVASKFDALKEKNETLGMVSDHILNEKSELRQKISRITKPTKRILKTAVSLGTGLGGGVQLTEYAEDVANLKSEDKKLKYLEEKNDMIDQNDSGVMKDVIQEQLQKTEKKRKKAIDNLYNQDVDLLQKNIFKKETKPIENLKRTDKLISNYQNDKKFIERHNEISDLMTQANIIERNLQNSQLDGDKEILSEKLKQVHDDIIVKNKDEKYGNIVGKLSNLENKREEIVNSLDLQSDEIKNRYVTDVVVEEGEPQKSSVVIHEGVGIGKLDLSHVSQVDIDDFLRVYESEYKDMVNKDKIEVFVENPIIKKLKNYKVFVDGKTEGIGDFVDVLYQQYR